MPLSPAIAIHLSAALAATAIGPVALWARRAAVKRPRIHRAAGYAWVTLMLATALSALFVKAQVGPRWGSFGLIHLLVPVTLGTLAMSFVYLARRDFVAHQKLMQRLYVGACLIAGAFTLLPERVLGQWLSAPSGLAEQSIGAMPQMAQRLADAGFSHGDRGHPDTDGLKHPVRRGDGVLVVDRPFLLAAD